MSDNNKIAIIFCNQIVSITKIINQIELFQQCNVVRSGKAIIAYLSKAGSFMVGWVPWISNNYNIAGSHCFVKFS